MGDRRDRDASISAEGDLGDMRLWVRHSTRYSYEQPVRLAGHRLRFKPRDDRGRLVAYALIVEPTPAAQGEASDAFGNSVARLEFDGLTDRLSIESRFEFVTDPPAPSDALDLPQLPWAADLSGNHAVYGALAEEDPAVTKFAAQVAAAAGGDPLAFLARLNKTLFEDFEHKLRFAGAALSPAETLSVGSGACRDVATLFMAACRSLGLPARFVSGYQARSETPDGRRHLHAWPEAFLPGLGWRGFDPTHGVAVTDGHVALSAAPSQAATMTVEGGYYGETVGATLEYDIAITAE